MNPLVWGSCGSVPLAGLIYLLGVQANEFMKWLISFTDAWASLQSWRPIQLFQNPKNVK